MPVSVTMPRLGESVTEGTVTRWLKAEGDRVEADEPLLEVSTDKVDTEVPSPASGVLTSIKVREDETVDIGVELAIISDGDESAAASAPDAEPEPAPVQAPEAVPSPAAAAPSPPEPVTQTPASPDPAPAATPAELTSSAPAQVAASAPAPSAPAPPAPAPPAGASSAPAAAVSAPSAPAPSAPAPSIPTDSAGRPAADDEDVAGTYVTPLVRKLASERGVDLNSVTGTGIGGRIRKADVLAAADRAASEAADRTAAEQAAQANGAQSATAGTAATGLASVRGRTEKLSRMRQVIAARMVESLQVSAQLTTVVEVDVTRIARLRARAKRDFEQREGVKLTFLPFFAVAAIEALKAHPVVNSSIDLEQKTVTYHDAEHLGIAVDTERGLAVPVIHNAGDLNLAGIARKIADLADRTRSNRISPDELGGGTFTLTNTGSRGALFDTPIINQPQVAILGTGTVVKRPVVVDDEDLGETIAIRSMIYLALSYDHRIVDGADAARFLGTVKSRLEDGNFERALGLS